MSGFETLKFFSTAPHPCSYLEGQEATTLFVEPSTTLSAEQVVKLAESGFRRSGRYTYRPHCAQCSACISVRVPVESFQPKRRQIRTLKKNQDVSFTARTPILDEERYELYRRYIEVRHADGDMYPPSPSQYESFLASNSQHAFFWKPESTNDSLRSLYSTRFQVMDCLQSTHSLNQIPNLMPEASGV